MKVIFIFLILSCQHRNVITDASLHRSGENWLKLQQEYEQLSLTQNLEAQAAIQSKMKGRELSTIDSLKLLILDIYSPNKVVRSQALQKLKKNIEGGGLRGSAKVFGLAVLRMVAVQNTRDMTYREKIRKEEAIRHDLEKKIRAISSIEKSIEQRAKLTVPPKSLKSHSGRILRK